MDNRHPEHQYLDLLQDILENGSCRMDRTGVGTRALFGAAMRFDLSDGSVPILTTKKVFWEKSVKEMLWFLTGDTNIRSLLERDVHIWSEWPHRRYVLETGSECTLEEFERLVLADDEFAARFGSIGPGYGFQWRKWPTKDGGHIDQVARCIEQLKHDRSSRRILFHGWNVEYIDEMALPPCHMNYQWCVEGEKLHLILYQRSCDIMLGAPFNLVGAAAILHMFAQQCGLEPGVIQWFGGDVHLYDNHVEAARIQLSREPRAWPKLRLRRKPDSIDGYTIDDFVVDGYEPHGFIKAAVAV